jgi:hypothetical protein
MAGEPRYLVEVIEAEKPPRIPPEYTEGLKGVLSAKRISALKKEVVNCPVIGSQVPFLVCFQCPSFLRRVKGTVQCAGKDPPRWPPSRSGDSSKRRDPPGRQGLRRPVHQPAKCPKRCEREALPGRASPLGGARRSDARLRPCLEDPLREGHGAQASISGDFRAHAPTRIAEYTEAKADLASSSGGLSAELIDPAKSAMGGGDGSSAGIELRGDANGAAPVKGV